MTETNNAAIETLMKTRERVAQNVSGDKFYVDHYQKEIDAANLRIAENERAVADIDEALAKLGAAPAAETTRQGVG